MVTIVQMGVSQFCQFFNKLGKLDKFHLETLEQLRAGIFIAMNNGSSILVYGPSLERFVQP